MRRHSNSPKVLVCGENPDIDSIKVLALKEFIHKNKSVMDVTNWSLAVNNLIACEGSRQVFMEVVIELQLTSDAHVPVAVSAIETLHFK